MDNCCCYTSTNSCINLYRKAVLFDSAAFLVKIGVAIYFLVVGIEYEIQDDDYRERHGLPSPSTVALYIFGGCILLILVVLRLIFNWILYNDSKQPENIMQRRSHCCSIPWLIATVASLIFSCVVVAIPSIPLIIKLTAWFSIIFEILMFLIVISFRRTVQQRFIFNDADSSYS